MHNASLNEKRNLLWMPYFVATLEEHTEVCSDACSISAPVVLTVDVLINCLVAYPVFRIFMVESACDLFGRISCLKLFMRVVANEGILQTVSFSSLDNACMRPVMSNPRRVPSFLWIAIPF